MTISYKEAIRRNATDMNGTDVFETEWHLAERIVAEDPRFTLTPPEKGFGGWKRLKYNPNGAGAMDHAEYVGPLTQLQGKRALIRPNEATYDLPLEQRTLLAQFDGAGKWGQPEYFGIQHPETGVFLSAGWHEFPVTDFKILVLV